MARNKIPVLFTGYPQPNNPFNGTKTVLDYGADPTGSTNSTAAFQRANAASLDVVLPSAIPGTPNQFRLADWTPLDGTVVRSNGPTGYLTPYVTSNIIVKHSSAADGIIKTNGKKSITLQGFHMKGVDRSLPLIQGGGDNITLRDITGYEGFCGYGKIDGTGITMQTSYVENCFFGNNIYGMKDLIDTTVEGGALFSNKTCGLYLGAGASFNNINTRYEFNGNSGGGTDGFNIQMFQANENIIRGTVDAGYLGGISAISCNNFLIDALVRRNGRLNSGTANQDCHVFLQDCSDGLITLMSKAALGDGGVAPTTPKYSVWIFNSDPAKNSNIVFYGDLSGNTVQDFIETGTVKATGIRNMTMTRDKPRIVTAAGAITVNSYDHVIFANKTVGAATTVNLPASPTAGDEYIIKDAKGDAGANNITITPAAGTIDGSGTLVISTNYGKARIVYSGTEWNQVS